MINYLRIRHSLYSVTYHLISLSLIAYVILSHQYKSGPCNPGFDLVAAFLGFIVCIALVIFSLVKLASKGKEYRFLLMVNLIALGILILICALP